MRAVTLLATLVWSSSILGVEGHAQCSDRTVNAYGNPQTTSGSFCAQYDAGRGTEGNCCSPSEDSALRNSFDGASAGLSATCATLHREFLCIPCDPWSAHIYQTAQDGTNEYLGTRGAAIKRSFANQYVQACGGGLAGNIIADNTLDQDYPQSYPLTDADKAYGVSSTSGLTPTYPSLGGVIGGGVVGAYMPPNENRWWVLKQDGRILEVDNTANVNSAREVLSVSNRIASGGEQGLLGLAFAPDFGSTGCFFVYYSDRSGTSNSVNRYFRQGNSISGGDQVFSIPSPFSNHNGGWIGFSPTGARSGGRYELFISSGDGGSGNDPNNYSQNDSSFLGKMLTASVSSSPSSSASANPSVYAKGLRNPWRCSFDRVDGRLFCGDVGQDQVEEVVQVNRGDNHGWKRAEGSCLNDCAGLKDPVFEYCHGGISRSQCTSPFTGNSITGGYVYRGAKYPDYWGTYFFGDFQNLGIGQITTGGGFLNRWQYSDAMVSAFAEDNAGEIYILNYSGEHTFYNIPCEFGGGDCSSIPPAPTPTAPQQPAGAPPSEGGGGGGGGGGSGACAGVGSCDAADFTCEVFAGCASGGLGCIGGPLNCRYCGAGFEPCQAVAAPIVTPPVEEADEAAGGGGGGGGGGGVSCGNLGWAGSCSAFNSAAACNCWAGSSFACSWSGSSCGTGGGGGGGGGGGSTPPSTPVVSPAACDNVGSCDAADFTCEVFAGCAIGGLGCIGGPSNCRYCGDGFEPCSSGGGTTNDVASPVTEGTPDAPTAGSTSVPAECVNQGNCASPAFGCDLSAACATVGGLGCIGGGSQCRYCGFGDMEPCSGQGGNTQTPTVVAAASSTVCDSFGSCGSEGFSCYQYPGCSNGDSEFCLLMSGDLNCRYCGGRGGSPPCV